MQEGKSSVQDGFVYSRVFQVWWLQKLYFSWFCTITVLNKDPLNA